MSGKNGRSISVTAVPPGVPRALDAFSLFAIIASLAAASLLLSGCGLTLNPTAAASGSQSASGSGGTGAVQGQIVPIPSSFQALTGCTNPNTGVSNGDWGVGSDPVFAWVSNTSPVVGMPVYRSNTVFWTSRENAPGQSILLAGAFTEEAKNVQIALIPSGTSDWQTIVRASTALVPTIQQGTTGLSFAVPLSFPKGVYGFEIVDPSASPVFGLANVPSLNWVVGVPSITDPAKALQHQVLDCAAEQGGTLRLFGKNFDSSNKVVLQSLTGAAYSLKPSLLDTNSASVTMPVGLAAGTYNLWIGTLPWSVTSSPAAQISITPSPLVSAYNFACPGVVGDGTTDITAPLQRCLDLYAPIGPGEVAFISLPRGNFLLTGPVIERPFEMLTGVSSTSTKIIGKPKGAPPAAWISMPHSSGIAHFSFQAPANPSLLASSGTLTGDPKTSGHLYVNDVNFSSTSDASGGSEVMFHLAGPDIQVYNSFFLSGSNQLFDINFGDGGIVSGNTFIVNNFTGLGISDSQNIIFEKNDTSSQNPISLSNNGTAGGSGLSISRGNSQWGQSALSQDIYIAYNSFHDMGSNSQQIIVNDGGGGSYLGGVASSTPDTIILANDPAWNWMGTTNPQAAAIIISYGTGVGQYSLVKSYMGRTINLTTPLKVLPDSTSIVGIVQYELNMTIAHNSIKNTLGACFVLGDALEGVVEDNLLQNCGQGMLISAFGPYGGPAAYSPVINTDVLRNTFSLGEGNDIAQNYQPNYIWGIGISDFPGCSVSGLMIRNNQVPSVQSIFNTDGVNGDNAVIVEHNQANWQPGLTTTGLLVQDNTPPLD
jgi:hypothetical protein